MSTTTKGGRANTYRQQVAAKRAATETFMVEVPSGFKWELRAPDLQGYIMSGRLPQSLVDTFIKSAKALNITPAELAEKVQTDQKTATQLLNQSTSKDVVDSLIFMREIVREACVNPRMVVGGVGEDEIDPIEVDPDDFRFIFRWCLDHSGVAGLQGLQTFREGRARGTATAKSRRKKLRGATV